MTWMSFCCNEIGHGAMMTFCSQLPRHVMKIRPWHSDEGLGGVKSRRLFPQHFPNWLELSRVVPEDAACYILIYIYNIILYNYIYIL